MLARFETMCKLCRRVIGRGAPIRRTGTMWVHQICPAHGMPDPDPKLAAQCGTEAFNAEWTRMKNEYAVLERQQENAAYDAEMRAEADLFEKHEGMPPV